MARTDQEICKELSDQFDVLYNNITSNQAPGLDEYEKSLFLTLAQDDVIKSYFNPRLNKPMEGFDGSETRQIDFSMILRTVNYTTFSDAVFDNKANSKRVTLPSDVMMFINEFADVTRDSEKVRLAVVPLEYREYSRLSSKPYKRPLHYQAWRILDNSNSTNSAEIIIGPTDTLTNYAIRYVKRPRPIVLGPLDGVSVDGVATYQSPEVDPILYPEMLSRGVELAKAHYVGDLNSILAIGSASKTEVGAVPQSR